jgi:uncharacterized protein
VPTAVYSGGAMTVGTLRLVLFLDNCRSLKAKRSVVKKVLERTKNRFNVAAAEVADNDRLDRATLAFVTVSNDGRLVNSALDKVVDFIDGLFLAQIADHQIELIHI